MSEHIFEAKQLTGSAKTIAPKSTRQFPRVTLSDLEGTTTAHQDSFFDLTSVVLSSDSFASARPNRR